MTETDKLDTLFSIFVRTRFADYRGFVLCYTCPTRGHWSEFDCGHFIKRQHLNTRWERDNCRPQCKHDNQYEEGKPETFETELREELGDARVEEMKESVHRSFEHDERWISDQVTHYRTILKPYI